MAEIRLPQPLRVHHLSPIHHPFAFKASQNLTPPSISSGGGGKGGDILPNALRRRRHQGWSGGGFSLGVDLGGSRTGVALGKGFSSPRPLAVLEMTGHKLELRLLDIAEKHEADEFIVGLPKSSDGTETVQSNKVRSVAGRLAVLAAERCWRVFLQDEHGTSVEALDYMINAGLRRSARQGKVDAYSAMMILERYFSLSGVGAELVLPKKRELQENLQKVPYDNDDILGEDSLFDTV